MEIEKICLTKDLIGIEAEICFDDYEVKRFIFDQELDFGFISVWVKLEVQVEYFKSKMTGEWKEFKRYFTDIDYQVYSEDGELLKTEVDYDIQKVLNNLTLKF